MMPRAQKEDLNAQRICAAMTAWYVCIYIYMFTYFYICRYRYRCVHIHIYIYICIPTGLGVACGVHSPQWSPSGPHTPPAPWEAFELINAPGCPGCWKDPCSSTSIQTFSHSQQLKAEKARPGVVVKALNRFRTRAKWWWWSHSKCLTNLWWG